MSAVLAAKLDTIERQHAFARASIILGTSRTFGWYDSPYLLLFEACKTMLQQTRPDELERFTRAFDVMRTESSYRTHIERGMFSGEELAELARIGRTAAHNASLEHEGRLFGREMVHNLPQLKPLHDALADRVSEWAGEEVVPSYSFLSRYSSDGRLEPHLDSPRAKYTLDICLTSDVDWPLYVAQPTSWPKPGEHPSEGWQERILKTHDFDAILLQPGDAALFSGSSQWHYRDPIPAEKGQWAIFLFFHYYPKAGEGLANPENWGQFFGLLEVEMMVLAYANMRERHKARQAQDA